MRPHQWVKNLFVPLPLVFAQELFHVHIALRVLAALGLFCLASSATYVLNDLVDVEADRAHPLKRNRPIASGRVPPSVARPFAVGLAVIVIGGGALISLSFLGMVAGYLVLNLAYSFKLKRLPYLDVLSIAAGFELRVLGGAYAAPVTPSLYLLLVTALLALFLGFGKRRHELAQATDLAKQRKALEGYDARALDILLYVTAIGTIAGYCVYTFDPATREAFGTDYLGITTIFAMFGVIRFLHLVRSRPHSESPTEDMIRDAPFILNALLWAAAVVFLIYLGT